MLFCSAINICRLSRRPCVLLLWALGFSLLGDDARAQGSVQPRSDTSDRIMAPKYLTDGRPTDPTGLDNPFEPLLDGPSLFVPPTTDYREYISPTPAEYQALSPLNDPAIVSIPSPGTALMILFGGAGLSAPRRRHVR